MVPRPRDQLEFTALGRASTSFWPGTQRPERVRGALPEPNHVDAHVASKGTWSRVSACAGGPRWPYCSATERHRRSTGMT